MKKSYQHIIKKSYTTPKIEEVEIDVAISLSDLSYGAPGDPPSPTGAASNQNTLDSAPKYPVEYRSETPFGGSTPIYE